MTGPDHERFREDPGAYLLGALADDEQRAFELHMESCPDCRDEVERLRPAADALPRSVEQVDPPERLKGSIMDIVEKEPRLGEATPPKRARRTLRDLIPARGFPRVAVAGAILALGLIVGFGVAQLGSDQEQRTIAAQVDAQRLPMASAELRVDGDGKDGAVLTAEGLPELSAGRVYQAWVERGKKFIPAPTFVASRDGTGSVAVPDDLRGAQAVLVTRERRGGAQTPGEPPIMRVEL